MRVVLRPAVTCLQHHLALWQLPQQRRSANASFAWLVLLGASFCVEPGACVGDHLLVARSPPSASVRNKGTFS